MTAWFEPKMLVVHDADSLGDFLAEYGNEDTDDMWSTVGVDELGRPFHCWVSREHWPESDAMMQWAGAFDEETAESGLTFPVVVAVTSRSGHPLVIGEHSQTTDQEQSRG